MSTVFEAGWTADSTLVTADSLYYTADGGDIIPSSGQPYDALITSEHNQRPKFMSLVDVLCSSMADITAGIQSIQPAFDLDQASGAQLDVLGLWIGQSRVISNVLLLGFFGFADDQAAATFGEYKNKSIGGIFYEYGKPFTSTTTLGDLDYLSVLRARITRNQSKGTTADIENALQFIFGVGASVQDAGNRTLNINVSSPITQTQQALLIGLDLLPRPAGVQIGKLTFTI